MKGTWLRIATGGAVVAVMVTVLAAPAAAAVTPTAAPVVNVANPHSGDYVRRGRNWITGVACDPNASMTDETAGISKITVYLGDRDTTIGVPWYRPGGYFGTATLGVTSPDVSTCKQGNSGWRVLPSSFRKGLYDLNIYVLAKNGKETKVTITGLRVDRP